VRTVHRFWSWLVVAAIVLQVGLAGYGAFYVADKVDGGTVNQDKFEDGFGPHMGFGYLVVLLILILLIITALAGIRGRLLGMTALLFGLGILQILLAWFGSAAPVIGFFHPVNAFVILGLAVWLAMAGRRPAVGVAPAA
jgi:hypothetical protein